MRTSTSSPLVAGARVDHLAESIRRAESHQVRVSLRLGAPEDSSHWVNCAQLLSEAGGFDRWRKELAGWLIDRYGEAPERTTAGYVMSWYLSVPGYLAALLFHHERRVPSLRPEHLEFRMARPRPNPDSIAVLDSRFACLPDDPAAGTPAATVVDSEQALAALLRARHAGHAARFAVSFQPPVHFGPHTLWGSATDALDLGLWNAGRFGGDEGAGVADAALVLPAALEPFTSASTLHTVCGDDGHAAWTRRKETCCFHYLVGETPCKTCPRVKPKR